MEWNGQQFQLVEQHTFTKTGAGCALAAGRHPHPPRRPDGTAVRAHQQGTIQQDAVLASDLGRAAAAASLLDPVLHDRFGSSVTAASISAASML